MIKILLIEPYLTGSHKQWVEGYMKYSRCNIRLLSLKGQFWKWRMHGGAITLTKDFDKISWIPDVILVTDMLDLTTFISLNREKIGNTPVAIYFHENQISYPWSPKDRDFNRGRDSHYGFINYASALVSNKVYFNSHFHMNSFFKDLEPFLKQFPDKNELDSIEVIKKKSEVLYLGLDLKKFDESRAEKIGKPKILWNHRWEYDKNPELFFSILNRIKKEGYDFNLIVLGERFNRLPEVFKWAKRVFRDNIIKWGYMKSFGDYSRCLWKCDILPVTSNQEFFGVSVMEAIYCGVWPILPERLSYPELIPESFSKDIIYSDENELYKKIVWSIDNVKEIRKARVRDIAEKFAWENMALSYDETLLKLYK